MIDYQFRVGALSVRQGRKNNHLGVPHVVWSYHCSETCFFSHSVPVLAFDHINVGFPAGFKGNGLLRDSCSSYFLPGGSVI